MMTSAALIAAPTSPTTLPRNSCSFASLTSLAIGISFSGCAPGWERLVDESLSGNAVGRPVGMSVEICEGGPRTRMKQAGTSGSRPGNQAPRAARGSARRQARRSTGLEEVAGPFGLPRGHRAAASARASVRAALGRAG